MLEFNEDVEFILGQPSFVCGTMAVRLRERGHKIENKPEAEQAYVIYWLLKLYEEHGKDWSEKAEEELAKKD